MTQTEQERPRGYLPPVLRPGGRYIRITTRCNHRCVFCNVDKSNPIPREEVLAAIRAIPPATPEVVITGGEPTLDPGLFRYGTAIQKLTGARLTLQTNGVRCIYPEYVGCLSRAGFNRVVVSYPSHDPEAYAALTGGDLRQVWAGLETLAASPMEVVLNCLLHGRSSAALPEFARWLVERFGSRIGVLFTTLIPAFAVSRMPDLFVRYSDLVPALRLAATVLTQSRVPWMIAGMYGIPPCLLGDLAGQSESWTYLNPNCHGEVGEGAFVKASGCGRCRFNRICLGVWADYAARHGVAELEPVPFRALPYPRVPPQYAAADVGRLRDHIDAFERGEPLQGHTVVWSVTSRCNCRCAMCVGSREGPDLDDVLLPDSHRNLADELASLGFRKVLFCGGEPTLVKGLPGLIRAVKQVGLSAFLNTNGLALGRQVDELLDAGLDTFILSLDSPDPGIHDAIRGVRGLHRKVLAAARAIGRRAGRDAVRFHTVMMRANLASLPGLVDLAADHGVGALDLTLVTDALGTDHRALRPDPTEMTRLYREILPCLLERAIRLHVRVHIVPIPLELFDAGDDLAAWQRILSSRNDGIDDQVLAFAEGRFNEHNLRVRPCWVPFHDLTIDGMGDVYPCGRSTVIGPRYRIGNLREQTLTAIWDGPASRAFRMGAGRHDACVGCFSCSRETEAEDRMLERPSLFLERR